MEDAPEIGRTLGVARVAAGLHQDQAAEAVGVSPQTIGNWEREAGEGTALKPIAYLRELSSRSSLAQDLILSILGLRDTVQRDPRIERKLDLVRAGYASDDPIIHAQLHVLELLLRERIAGEHHAASA